MMSILTEEASEKSSARHLKEIAEDKAARLKDGTDPLGFDCTVLAQGVKRVRDDHITETFGEIPVSKEKTIEDTLAERQSNYGNFAEHARITQSLKRCMINTRNWADLSDDKKETFDMIAHKIGRILNGDPEYKDSWHDIIGYTKLIDDTLTD